MDPHPSGLDGDNRAPLQILPIARQRVDSNRTLSLRAQRDEADYAAVGLPSHNRDLAEVLIQRDQHLGVLMRMGKNGGIAWILRPIGSRLDIMSGSNKHFARAAPDATIEQHSHDSAIRQCGLDSFVADDSPGVHETGADVFGLQPRVTAQDDLRGVSCGEHSEDVLDGKTMPSDDRLAAEDLRARRNAREKCVFRLEGHKSSPDYLTLAEGVILRDFASGLPVSGNHFFAISSVFLQSPSRNCF